MRRPTALRLDFTVMLMGVSLALVQRLMYASLRMMMYRETSDYLFIFVSCLLP